jgi:threonine aldolase
LSPTQSRSAEKQSPSEAVRSAVTDLRSDTVTKPTPEMRRAMADAEVGDDVYGEDPTVNRLEQRAAEIFGREAAIFTPTGSMANQIAIKVHTQPGQEIICEERAHIFNWEMATLSSFSGCVVRPVRSDDGVLRWEQIKPYIAPKIYYRAPTGLIVLENTHNMAGGTVTPSEIAAQVCQEAKAAGLPVHLDGARVFNAAAALGTNVKDLTRGFDSVMFCLSKGLCAPVGSLLVGSRTFIDQARIYRKALGGGMRQAGILAAAGLIALEEMPKRLTEDHANARLLAEGLSKLPQVKIDLKKVQTNIVIFDLAAPEAMELVKFLAEHNVLASAISPSQIRFVTHRDVSRAQCEAALRAVEGFYKRN